MNRRGYLFLFSKVTRVHKPRNDRLVHMWFFVCAHRRACVIMHRLLLASNAMRWRGRKQQKRCSPRVGRKRIIAQHPHINISARVSLYYLGLSTYNWPRFFCEERRRSCMIPHFATCAAVKLPTLIIYARSELWISTRSERENSQNGN